MVNFEEIYKEILRKVEQYIYENTCWDENSKYFGALLDSQPLAPEIRTLPHTAYPSTDAYSILYMATKDEDYKQKAIAGMDYLLREQSDIGAWVGYQGFLSDRSNWTEENAPPGSILRIKRENLPEMDLIRQPFSPLGTSLYGKVIYRGYNELKNSRKMSDIRKASEYYSSFIAAVEFIYGITTENGLVIIDPGWISSVWNKIAEPASLLFIGYNVTKDERFKERAVLLCRRVLRAQFNSGEFPYAGESGHTLHYHFLVLSALQECEQYNDDEKLGKEIKYAIRKGLNFGLKTMLKKNGNFDWSLHDPKDHKARLSATFGLAIQAASYNFDDYREELQQIVQFIYSIQKKDGGFPFHIGEESTDNRSSADIFHGLACIAKYEL